MAGERVFRRRVVLAVLVALWLAALMSLARSEDERDLAQLTAKQRREVVGRWYGQ